MREEGWYRDPYGLHTDRWFSDGRPTKLVRDERAESYDDPPPGDPPRPLVPVPIGPSDNSDTKRADTAAHGDQAYDPKKAFIAAADRALINRPVRLENL
jgi:hypothetical protein